MGYAGYIDFGAGLAVNALGHQHPDLLAAPTTQARKRWRASNVCYTEPHCGWPKGWRACTPL